MRLTSIYRVLQASFLLAFSLAPSGLLPASPQDQETCTGVKPLPALSYASHFGQQAQLRAESSTWLIKLAEWEPLKWPPKQFTFEVKNATSQSTVRITLPAWDPPSQSLQINQIDELAVVEDTDRLLILGRSAAASSEANLVSLPSGKILDRFPCFMPTVSPDGRFLAFLKSFPGHPGPMSINAEYLVYDLAQSPAHNRPHSVPSVTYDAGWPEYPPGATNAVGSNLLPGLESPVHWISSERLFWLDARTLAFTDHYPSEDRFVVVDLSRGIQAASVRTKTLNPSDLTDFSRCASSYSQEDFRNISFDPSGILHVRQISPAPGRSGHVCVRFDPNPCLTHTNIILELP